MTKVADIKYLLVYNANKEQSQGQNKKAKFVSEDSELTEIAQNEESVLEVILPKYF